MCSPVGATRCVVERSTTDEPGARRRTDCRMNHNQRSSISNARSPEEIGEYWDSHSLADHWDETHEVEFEVRAPHRITLEPEVYARHPD
jgi:hypothetical protein